jgi:hypothetical protein
MLRTEVLGQLQAPDVTLDIAVASAIGSLRFFPIKANSNLGGGGALLVSAGILVPCLRKLVDYSLQMLAHCFARSA